MTYKFKLSRRLAIIPTLAALAMGCQGESSVDAFAPSSIADADSTIVSLQIVPDSITAETGQTVQLAGYGRDGNGDSTAVDSGGGTTCP